MRIPGEIASTVIPNAIVKTSPVLGMRISGRRDRSLFLSLSLSFSMELDRRETEAPAWMALIRALKSELFDEWAKISGRFESDPSIADHSFRWRLTRRSLRIIIEPTNVPVSAQ